MHVAIGETEPGQLGIIFTDGKSFYHDVASRNDNRLLTDPESFFMYAEKAATKGKLMLLPKPTRFRVPSPVNRIFLPAINFRPHSAEAKVGEKGKPYFFLKFPTSLVPHEGVSYIPRGVKKYDYEGEIAIVIGKSGKYLSREDASSIIFGYSVVNDLSIRDFQMPMFEGMGKDWVMGKAADYSLPYGPWILPKEETDDFRFNIKTKVNGETRQDGSTDDMIFSPEELISHLSNVTTLRPGDIVTTGTPGGVAVYNDTGFLKNGDKVEVSVEGIGTLVTNIVAEE